jgi:Kef-type K+ transport system membrane component KefB
MMAVRNYFLALFIVLLSARLFTDLAVRLKTPPVIGELVAGDILGPSLLDWVESVEEVKLVAEIGIIMLLLKLAWKPIKSIVFPAYFFRSGPL